MLLGERKRALNLFPPSKLFTYSGEKQVLDAEDCLGSVLLYVQPSEHEFILLISYRIHSNLF